MTGITLASKMKLSSLVLAGLVAATPVVDSRVHIESDIATNWRSLF